MIGEKIMADLFVYGTLMREDIMRTVAGTVPRRQRGTARGYRRLAVKNEHYPGLIAEQGSEVEGLVYLDITEESWARLDRFEGEMYTRGTVEVLLEGGDTLQAYAYLVKPEYVGRLEKRDWDFAGFLENGKGAFVGSYSGYNDIQTGGLPNTADQPE
jgi:gamma-glutamylcyclotransferase (GGCT)/AIG2-like uncharacterized protein YtfP